jgi:diguanylate cyclase (GGDEF)-like protein
MATVAPARSDEDDGPDSATERSERVALDALIDALTGDDGLPTVLKRVLAVAEEGTLHGHAAVIHGAPGRRFHQQVMGSVGSETLVADHPEVATPWRRAVESARPMCIPTDKLPASVREDAEERGFTWCFAWPVTASADDATTEALPPSACLIVWRTEGGRPEPAERVLLDRLAAVIRLALAQDSAHAQLHHAATHDPLTGLPNRSLFLRRLTDTLSTLGSGFRIGVLHVGLDEFKSVNERFGHGEGDEVLVTVARRLRGMFRSQDLVARLGGDEFVVLCTAIADERALQQVAARISTGLADPIAIGHERMSVGASIGTVLATGGRLSPDELMDHLEDSLRGAKKDRRGSWPEEDPTDDDGRGEGHPPRNR